DGQKFLDNMNGYREGMIQVLGENNPTVAEIRKKFNTEPVENKDGKKIDYLNYHFEHYPFISSMTKLSMFQSDIRTIEAQVLGDLLQGQLISEVSMDNYKAIVIPEKSAFFNGENFKGRVVLGRYDATMVPTEVVINGQKQETIEQGQVVLDFPAGAVGERELKGKFVFMENGEPKEIEINDTYAVIPKPNSATISADKMNVVYRGVDNPMTISFAGVSDNNVNASAPGLTRKSGSSYIMRPGTGTEVTINVTGTLPDGQKVSDGQKFRIKNIPRPTGTVRGDNTGFVKMPKSTLEKVDIGAELVDFDFDLKLGVKAFKLSVPGQPTVAVNGNKLNAAAVNALKKAKRGDIIQIFDINADIVGNSIYNVGNVSGVSVEITN
ncbi:MAG: gliding motility protein GldM, partial [Flavobacteriaceae bacterium]|nr:gliding motility protein GldM [Flavobacteriaceae bacterium]